jgi:hypothetical protein
MVQLDCGLVRTEVLAPHGQRKERWHGRTGWHGRRSFVSEGRVWMVDGAGGLRPDGRVSGG